MVRIIPLGGASEIGGSCLYVELFDARVVVDFGLRPGARSPENRYPDLEAIAERGAPHAVAVTHAHIDHTGGLPLLHRWFPDVPVFATQPTIWIARTLLQDSVKIMDRDFEGEVDYTLEDVASLRRVFEPVRFHAPRPIASTAETRVMARFIRAGHIMGAAMIALEAEHLPTGRVERVLVSGDVSLFDQPTILGLALEEIRGFEPSIFVCEGTYGDDEHPDFAVEEAGFAKRVAEVLRVGGRVVIPAFAVGRAQNVALILRNARRRPERFRELLDDPEFQMPPTYVYVDGMCRTICDHYSELRSYLRPDAFDPELDAEHAFFDPRGDIHKIGGRQERERMLSSQNGTGVFISSSGMLNGGPSVSYAADAAPNPSNAILLCGYQDEESPGRAFERLTGGREGGGGEDVPRVELGGRTVPVRCQVAKYNLSAHSDAADIEQLMLAVRPQKMVLVHGEPRRLAALRNRLEDTARERDLPTLIDVGHIHESVEAEAEGAYRSMLPPVRHASSRWVQKLLTGRAARGGGQFDPVRSWVTAALTTGRSAHMSDEDVARMDALVPTEDPVGADELDATRGALEAGAGLLWGVDRIGTESYHVPRGPDRAGEGRISLVSLRHQARRRVSQKARRDHRLEAHFERVREMGISLGDLVLFVSGTAGYPRLQPAVLLEEAPPYGFRVLAPSAVDSQIAANQIAARVAPWPWMSAAPTGMHLPAMQEDAQLLSELSHALARFTVDYFVRERSALAQRSTEETGQMLQAVWTLHERGALSWQSAALASALFTAHRHRSVVQATLHDLVRLMGGTGQTSEAIVDAAIQELNRYGLLKVRLLEEGLEITWTDRALAAFTRGGGGGSQGFQHLGSHFQETLHHAFLRALQEIDRLGIIAAEDGEGGSGYVGFYLGPPREARDGEGVPAT